MRGQRNAINPWCEKMPEERFPGRGYLPQALTHGTRECDDKEVSARFYSEVLGLEIAGAAVHRCTSSTTIRPGTWWCCRGGRGTTSPS